MLHSVRVTHANGTAAAAPAKVSTRRGRGFRLDMTNLEAAGGNMLEISFDSGNNFFSIPPQTTWTGDVAFHYFYVRGSGLYTGLIYEG